MTKPALIYNPKSGSGAASKNIESIFRKFFPDSLVFTLEPAKSVEEIVKDAYDQGARIIVAAGGDGTISSIVGAILKLSIEVRLGIIPIGTLNHFAKDLGIPLDIAEACVGITNGETKLIDVAQVNDQYFINNSNLGLYPAIVRDREALQKRGWKKWPAFVATAVSMLYRHDSLKIRFSRNSKRFSKKTSFVFVGNNKYAVSGRDIGTRKKLDEGILTVCIAHHTGRFRMIILGIKALLGTILYEKDFNVIGMQTCIVSSREPEILVSYDGEVRAMTSPLQYAILPKILSVIIPTQLS